MEEFRYTLLKDDLDLVKAEELQLKYQSLFKKLKIEEFVILNNITNIAAVDISYFKEKSKEYGISCAVLWNISDNRMVCNTFYNDEVRFPYHPGFLGFRECRLLAKAVEKLTKKPDLIICDGHGIIHPKRFGEAVQLGFALNIPSIGVAKKPFIGYYEYKLLKRKKGNKEPILSFKPNSISISEPELLGYAICLNDNMKPVFISRGYRATLNLAIDIALKTTLNHRQPEPLYLAHQLSKKRVKDRQTHRKS
ncbi:MAG: endonuclease V [Candidatus Heimdallarchaeota archaeon]